jgi:predicted amidohydrolase YtcJ
MGNSDGIMMPRKQDFQSSHAGPDPSAPADLLLTNGRIWTGEAVRPWASAILIRGGRIAAIGDAIDQPARCTFDLGGRFVMPGLYDAHTHPDLATMMAYNEDLEINEDLPPAALAERVRAYAARFPSRPWIFGAYWVRYQFRRAGIVPDRHWLDGIVPDRPAALMDRSWGAALVNTRALAEMGMTAATPDPNNGYIERDPMNGEPTGILVDGAYALVQAAMPPTPIDVLERGYRDGLHFQASRGVVGTKYPHVCERRLEALRRLDQRGLLTARVEAAISWQDDIFPVRRRWELLAGERHHFRSARLNPNAVKFHFDGTFEARSAYLADGWDGNEAWRGHLNLAPAHLADMVTDMDRRGIRVIAHCVGDAASDIFLDAVAEARQRNGALGVRHQCAHSTVLLRENLPRFAALDVVCEFSPVGWYMYPFAERRLNAFNAEQQNRFFNFRGAVDAGAIVVMGTDCPVSALDPWLGFEAMTTRASPTDRAEARLIPGDPLTLEEAMRVMTINGSKSLGVERIAGSLAVGKSADLIVLDRDLFAEPARGYLHATQVDITLIEGEVAWDRQGELERLGLPAVWGHDLPHAFAG